MIPSRKTLALVGTLGLAFAASGAWAQDATQPQSDSMSQASPGHDKMKMHNDMMGRMGAHSMPATVTSVDPATGLVDATAEQMSLKLHFPPASMANLKAGDRITVHLSFSKP